MARHPGKVQSTELLRNVKAVICQSHNLRIQECHPPSDGAEGYRLGPASGPETTSSVLSRCSKPQFVRDGPESSIKAESPLIIQLPGYSGKPAREIQLPPFHASRKSKENRQEKWSSLRDMPPREAFGNSLCDHQEAPDIIDDRGSEAGSLLREIGARRWGLLVCGNGRPLIGRKKRLVGPNSLRESLLPANQSCPICRQHTNPLAGGTTPDGSVPQMAFCVAWYTSTPHLCSSATAELDS